MNGYDTTKMPSWHMPQGIESLWDYYKCLIFHYNT